MSFSSLQPDSSDMLGDNIVLDAEAYKNEGSRRLKNYNDVQGAVKAYTKAILLSKSNYIYYNHRAMAYLLLNDSENAIKDCNTSLELCKNITAHCRKATALGKLRRFDEGITAVLKALDMDPKDVESSKALETLLKDQSRSSFRKEDDTPQGIANKELNEKLIQRRAGDLCEEGKELIRMNNYKDGINCMTQAITLSPSSYKFYNFRALSHKLNGDYKKALIDCEKSWQLHKNVDAYNLKGSILSKQKKYNDAIDCIVLCLEIDPEHKDSILLHEQIHKRKQGRNRAVTLTINTAHGKKGKWAKKGTDAVMPAMLKSPSKFMSKLSSPTNSDREEDPWHNVSSKHTRSETAVKKNGAIRIVDRFEWQDFPAEHSRANMKYAENRGAKTVRMKTIQKKPEEVSRFKQLCSNAYIFCVGAVMRAMSTDGVRRASVSPEVKRRRSRGLTPVM